MGRQDNHDQMKPSEPVPNYKHFKRQSSNHRSSSSTRKSIKLESSSAAAAQQQVASGNRKDATTSEIQAQLLDRIADEILDHTKQLGLFDEMRTKLLDDFESSREFHRIKSDFKYEVDSFCSDADLTLPRSKLRERLNKKTFSRSVTKLEDYVYEMTRHKRSDLKRLYNNHALEFLKTINKEPPPLQKEEQTTNVEQQDNINKIATITSTSLPSIQNNEDSLTDSGISSVSPPPSANKRASPLNNNNQTQPAPLPVQPSSTSDTIAPLGTSLNEIPLPETPVPPKKVKKFKSRFKQQFAKIEIKLRPDSICFQNLQKNIQ